MNAQRANGDNGKDGTPHNGDGSAVLSDFDADFEQIPFGPEDDAPIDDELKSRWNAKLRARRAAHDASEALGCTGDEDGVREDSILLAAPDNDPEAAIAALDRKIAAAPHDPMLLYQRGNLLMRLGRYDRATHDYGAVISIQANNEQYVGHR